MPSIAPALAACVACVAFATTVDLARAGRMQADEIAQLCAQADDSSHCGRLVEEVLLKRLPGLAARDGSTLKVMLYPAGNATFVDVETLHGGRSYSLWDYLDGINAVLLYTTDHDNVTFTLVQRASGRKAELPTEPVLSPDRQRLATADFCAERCTNELAVWRVTREGIRKEYEWKPKASWTDAGAKWKDADTLVIEYTPAGADKASQVERKLSDPTWIRSASP